MIDLRDFSYLLPPSSIANRPSVPKDHSRLLELNRHSRSIDHHRFDHLTKLLGNNDVLVFNQSKVFPARLIGQKTTGGVVEILLINPIGRSAWLAIASPRLPINSVITYNHGLSCRVIESAPDRLVVDFNLADTKLMQKIYRLGSTPIPPYIHTQASESLLRRQYQTVYAKTVGSCAAPTAGLHFTRRLLKKLATAGVQLEFITLHVGLGTFQKLRPVNLLSGKLHSEAYSLDRSTASRLLRAKRLGKRIIAVGTTVARTLETVFASGNNPPKFCGDTDLFVRPPYRFVFVDSLITNFHLPQSSLLMLVSAFVSYPNTPYRFKGFPSSSVGLAYSKAVADEYRFFSFGDAMWIHS